VSFLAAILVAVAPTSLNITVWPNGQGEAPRRAYTLRCNPVAGTLPKRTEACAKLAKLNRPFAPVPKDVACIQLYGGPQEALVTGRYRGHTVRALFNRADGCEIARWNRVRFLFPGAVAAADS
jgi:Subtilisin inhibitor-like